MLIFIINYLYYRKQDLTAITQRIPQLHLQFSTSANALKGHFLHISLYSYAYMYMYKTNKSNIDNKGRFSYVVCIITKTIILVKLIIFNN